MPDPPLTDPSTPNSRFEAVVEQFLRQREAGGNPDRQRYLASFPDLAPLLRDYFAGADLFDRLAPALAPQAQATLPTASAAVLPPGERVGGFELLEEVGRGGMGVVYKARQVGLNRVVALKMILSGSHASPGELARFRSEAEAVARLNHPNVVQVHEVGEVDGRPFFSMEFVAGGSLDRKLSGLPGTPTDERWQSPTRTRSCCGTCPAAKRSTPSPSTRGAASRSTSTGTASSCSPTRRGQADSSSGIRILANCS
jgi:serine/threonine protein kinase